MARFIGIDPGLQYTGWGIVDIDNRALRFIAAGVIQTKPTTLMPLRLLSIQEELKIVIGQHQPQYAAIEETFVNNNYRSSLLLSQARGVAMVTLAGQQLIATEYAANVVKKAIVGRGHADKQQVLQMLQYLMPGLLVDQIDAADALAVAVCHAHHMQL